MKKGIVVLTSLVALMLLSFAPPQEKKVVRLKNGNYKVQELKLENEDIEAIQELVEDMSGWFIENKNRSEKNKKEDGRKQYQDLMDIFESAEGFEAVVAFGNEEEHYILTDEIGSDVVNTILVYRTDDKEDDEKKEAFRGGMDDIMGKYL